ncbi:unnamed protein product [Ostreobium quekettii]|uniref:Uncharacterized protein n=1 Tax=Ostreobium quekettii TaxID=121088 RepID=A0A8S1JCU7_9CHLO|nr:unnamed protein product [Ostreobium quekettii]|eukprot:evm.model.scf_3538.1 EVM.evm.TU.scf_3538.1   scf_3538:10547-11107(+)
MCRFVRHRVFGDTCKAVVWAAFIAWLVALPLCVRYVQLRDARSKGCQHIAHHNEGVHHDGIFYAFLAASAMAVAAAGAWGRLRMRSDFGICQNGRDVMDQNRCHAMTKWMAAVVCCDAARQPVVEAACLWLFCSRCALCQETRTVLWNNVRRGEWRGPEEMALVTGLPAVSLARGVPMFQPQDTRA